MKVLVSDTSVLIDLDRGALVEATFRLPFEFTVPDLLYERELREHGGPDFVRLGLKRGGNGWRWGLACPRLSPQAQIAASSGQLRSRARQDKRVDVAIR